ncbi:MAG: phosphatidate cytidylyltransferase [candidate division WOR-3 bacterium]|nr:MAG: phosphatidate cytidylyltransferase [candidate division WOR-3 bacterium]
MAASRELKKRSLTGLVLITITIAILWLDHILLPLLLVIFITFANNEYFRFWHRKDIYPHTLAMLLPGYAIPFLVYYEVPLLLPFSIFFVFICLLAVMRFPGSRRKPNFLAETTAALFGIIYLSLLPSSLIPLRKLGFGVALMPLLITWLYDTFAYLAGSSLGRHKMATTISPNKSWEGTLLAFPLTFPFTFLLSKLWIDSFNLFDMFLVTIGIGVMATIGDLFESGMKREVGLKDASKVFPGHGGFLDRLDSLILTVPFFYLYLILQK